MSETATQGMEEEQPCDLCGLPIGLKPWVLQSATRTYAFCCEGCLGIFQMLHDIEVAADAAPARGQR